MSVARLGNAYRAHQNLHTRDVFKRESVTLRTETLFVQAVSMADCVYYAFSRDGVSWWGHGTNTHETLADFVARLTAAGAVTV